MSSYASMVSCAAAMACRQGKLVQTGARPWQPRIPHLSDDLAAKDAPGGDRAPQVLFGGAE